VGGVGCFVDSCRKCEPCRKGLEQYCVEGATMTYNALEKGWKNPYPRRILGENSSR